MAELNKDTVRSETLPLMVLVDTANVVQRGLEKRLSHLKLSVAQQRILTLVYFAYETLTPTMLAALLLQETHSVSGLLNSLEDRYLITLTGDRKDRRVIWVELTPAGREISEEATRIVLAMASELDPVLRGPKSEEMLAVLSQTRDTGFKIAGVQEGVRQGALRRVWG